MTVWKRRSSRTLTGAKRNRNKKSKVYQKGRDYLPMQPGEKRVKLKKGRGGSVKRVMTSGNIVNVMIDKKAEAAKLLSVKENAADRQFARRNIVTKGAIVETDKGLVKITSRPGQVGFVNGILLSSSDSKKESGKENKQE